MYQNGCEAKVDVVFISEPYQQQAHTGTTMTKGMLPYELHYFKRSRIVPYLEERES